MNLIPDLRLPVDEDEWMDTCPFDPVQARRALAYLGLTNRRFGGTEAVLGHFRRWARRWRPGEPVNILDVGTGGADIPVALARWGRETGHPIRITAVELQPPVAELARESVRAYPEITVLVRDLRDIPKELTFDYVTASLFLHHMPLALRAETLHCLDRRARRGLVVSDLRRSLPAYWAVGLSSWIWGDRMVRHDGPLSVRRAFRVEELAALAAEAGLGYLSARRESWFRVSLAGERA